MADDDETSFKEESAPPPKRARRAVTKRKPITVAPDSDDDDDDDYEPVEPLTKLEDESGNSDNDNDNDNEDDSFAAPSTSADDQPGPSGLGKDGVEAPITNIKQEDFEPNISNKATKCHVCQKVLSSNKKLRNHLSIHGIKGHCCEICKKRFSRSSEVKNHLLTHTGERNFACDICPKTFPLKSTLAIHKKTVHGKEGKIICEICSSVLTRSAYAIHKRNHLKEYVVKCEECGIGFITNADFERHKIAKHGLQLYVCNVCGKSFSRLYCLNLHIARHAKADTKSGIKCSECDKVFADERLAKIHQVTVHEKRYTGTHTCDLCGKVFPTVYKKKKHLKVHEKNKNEVFTCKTCGEIFTFRKSLYKHMFSHSEGRPHKCEDCSKTFAELRSLKIHQRKAHGK